MAMVWAAVALRFKAEPSVPRADVEHALAAQIFGDRIAGVALFLHRERHVSVDHGAVRKLEAVIPAFGEQVLAEIQPPCGFARRRSHHLRKRLSLRT